MKTSRIILCIAFFASLLSCKDGLLVRERLYMLIIDNKSDQKICYYKALQGSPHMYPDTTLPFSKPTVLYVDPKNKYYDASRKKWGDIINDTEADTISVYIFDAAVFDNTDWNVIRDSYKVQKRYSVSAEYLNNNNNTIVFP